MNLLFVLFYMSRFGTNGCSGIDLRSHAVNFTSNDLDGLCDEDCDEFDIVERMDRLWSYGQEDKDTNKSFGLSHRKARKELLDSTEEQDHKDINVCACNSTLIDIYDTLWFYNSSLHNSTTFNATNITSTIATTAERIGTVLATKLTQRGISTHINILLNQRHLRSNVHCSWNSESMFSHCRKPRRATISYYCIPC